MHDLQIRDQLGIVLPARCNCTNAQCSDGSLEIVDMDEPLFIGSTFKIGEKPLAP